tara:strand:+ start:560 stop:1753 length:1194 start_codon:yes stop_codon:yes gene_type:complete
MGGRSSAPQGTQQVSSTVTQNRLDPYAKPYYMNMMRSAEALLGEGYTPYQGQRIAEFTPDQLGAYQGIRAVAGRQMPGLGQARDTAMGLAQGINVPQITSAYQGREVAPTYQGREVSPVYQGNQFQEERILDRMQDYQNPYTENVLDRLQQRAIDRFDEQQSRRGLQQAQRGAFGGSRAALQDMQAERDLEDRLGDIEAQQLQKGFTQASGLAARDIDQAMKARQLGDLSQRAAGQQFLTSQQLSDQAQRAAGTQFLTSQQLSDQAMRAAGTQGIQVDMANQRGFFGGLDAQMRAAGMLPGIESREQQLDLARLNALRGVGVDQQTMQQSFLDQAYQDFVNQRDAPRQSLSFYNSLLQGLGNAPVSSDVMEFQPRPNPYAQALNLGLGAFNMYQGMN